jgi:hypothetical protein
MTNTTLTPKRAEGLRDLEQALNEVLARADSRINTCLEALANARWQRDVVAEQLRRVERAADAAESEQGTK